MDSVLEKQCSSCGCAKTEKEFYVDRQKPSGLSTYCKECSKARASKRYVKKGRLSLSPEEKEGRRKVSQKKYRDSHQQQIKAYSYAYNNSPQGKARGAAFREVYKEDIRVYKKSLYENNKELRRKKSAAYYAQNAETIKQRVRNRRINNRAVVNAEKRAYKAWRRTEENLLTREERGVINVFYKYAAEIGCVVDHIIPREKGGRHCLGNIQALPERINLKKSTKIGRFTHNSQGICCLPFFEGIKEDHLLKILDITKAF